jgi:hypothetical protein
MKSTYLVFAASVGLFLTLGSAALCAPSDIVWTDNVELNPVIASPGFGDNRAYYTHVLYDENAGIWRAWFDASSGFDVGYAESTDQEGTEFTNYALTTGFLSGKQSKAFVVQTGPQSFRMWYMSDDRQNGYNVSSAVSSDGINWTEDDFIFGIGDPNPLQFGPTERIAVVMLEDDSFVAYVRAEEPDQDPNWVEGTKRLYRYISQDGVNWTWTNDTGVSGIEGMENLEFSSVVKHPDLENTWYAWGSHANSSEPIYSFVSTDDGMTFELDEAPVANVGEIGTQPYNAERNYHASVTYLGDGNWVMFRSVAEPKTTARATGVEQLTSVKDWELR